MYELAAEMDADFEAYAVEIGLGDEWVAWSADESCPQEHTVATDTEAPVPWHTGEIRDR